MRKNQTRLEWNAIDLESKLTSLVEAVNNTSKKTPPQNTRMLRKADRWREQLLGILESISRIKEGLAPTLEKELGVSLRNNELLEVAMFQPSTKNLFIELETHYRNSEDNPLDKDGFTNLVSLSDMGQAIALVGDAAISMAVLHHLWKPSAADAGTLTQNRADIVSNQHLAKVCDSWQIYEHRIHFDPGKPNQSEMEHDKGTLLEAVYGIIYIQYGLEKVDELISHLLP
jgi:ribonuclease-3